MTSLFQLQKAIDEILSNPWERRDSKTTPDPQDLQFGNSAIEQESAVLYADIANSTRLVQSYNDWFAATVYKTFLLAVGELIKNNGGSIAAFHGDRVMGIFAGRLMNSAAAKCALQINHLVSQEINPRIKTKYPNSAFELTHAVGIDTGKILITRPGLSDSHDLIWVGRPANYAAKLCSLRDGQNVTFITSDVFDKLPAETKFGGTPLQNMWTKFVWEEYGAIAYKSAWRWTAA